MSRYTTLALDLEGTLISNAVSQFARPGLYPFLEFCRARFARIVTFTAVSETRVAGIKQNLVTYNDAPAWFTDVENVRWSGPFKDLNFVVGATPAQVLIVDDQEAYIHPDQKGNWIPVAEFEPPYPQDDTGLQIVQELLLGKLGG